MKRETQVDWRAIFQEQAENKLSVAEFCERHDIGQIYFWKRKKSQK